MPGSAILLITCPDQRGIVAAVTTFISRHQGNILDLQQHVDASQNVFFMRVEWEEAGFDLGVGDFARIFEQEIGRPFSMDWNLGRSCEQARMAVLVTRESHCLYDILARHQAREWNVEIPLVVANREDLRPVAEQFGIPFHCLPVTPDTKGAQEERLMALLREVGVDTLVLARYMQVLSDRFVAAWPNRIINIHHSFLPAFAGAKPYHAAHARGVKIIGATSHYVTAKLDEGPIIDQDVIRVSHEDAVEDLAQRGRDVEKIVLSRAITAHLERRVLVYHNKTVVFS